MVEIKVQGLAELERTMLALPQRIARNSLNAALLAAAQPIVKTAQAKAPVLKDPDPRRRPGTLRKNIRAKKVRATPGNAATVIVSVRQLSRAKINSFKATGRKAANNPDDPFYARFVEIKPARRRGRYKAQPFLRPAFSSNVDEALARFRDKLAERLQIAQSSGGLAR